MVGSLLMSGNRPRHLRLVPDPSDDETETESPAFQRSDAQTIVDFVDGLSHAIDAGTPFTVGSGEHQYTVENSIVGAVMVLIDKDGCPVIAGNFPSDWRDPQMVLEDVEMCVRMTRCGSTRTSVADAFKKREGQRKVAAQELADRIRDHPFACDKCKARYKTQSGLDKHKEAKHP